MPPERSGAEPPWRRLYASLRADIESGRLRPGDSLPSIRTLSQETGHAGVTVRKAIQALKEDGLVETVSGWGTFVAAQR
jgi:DNA-binding GntR family transcriptional regulator